jgi:predicted PhzF superfamily epimerase YddE/YHI9
VDAARRGGNEFVRDGVFAKSADGYNLRWFTPVVEVELCGHATLASAHVLWEAGHLPPNEQARFHTHSGLLTATHKEDWIELDFPANLAQRQTRPQDF